MSLFYDSKCLQTLSQCPFEYPSPLLSQWKTMVTELNSLLFVFLEQSKGIDHFIANCELSRLLQELIGSYIMMEEYFMREMSLKVGAIKMTCSEEPQVVLFAASASILDSLCQEQRCHFSYFFRISFFLVFFN